jgi:uncharacterized membrane protein
MSKTAHIIWVAVVIILLIMLTGYVWAGSTCRTECYTRAGQTVCNTYCWL